MPPKRKRVPPPVLKGPLEALSEALTRQQWDHELTDGTLCTGVHRKGVYVPTTISWVEEVEVLHFVCLIECTPSELAVAEIEKLIDIINQKFYVGHFEYRPENGGVVFRYGCYVAEGEQSCDTMLVILETCGQSCACYAPAFKQVAEGMTADAALSALEASLAHPRLSATWADELEGAVKQ